MRCGSPRCWVARATVGHTNEKYSKGLGLWVRILALPFSSLETRWPRSLSFLIRGAASASKVLDWTSRFEARAGWRPGLCHLHLTGATLSLQMTCPRTHSRLRGRTGAEGFRERNRGLGGGSVVGRLLSLRGALVPNPAQKTEGKLRGGLAKLTLKMAPRSLSEKDARWEAACP